MILREVALQTRPDGPATHYQLDRVWVDIKDRRDGFVRVVYTERDLDSLDGIVFARLEGWIPSDAVTTRQVRAFYHFRAPSPTPESWDNVENGRYLFHLRWEPLVPKPSVLNGPQQSWLDEFYDQLATA